MNRVWDQFRGALARRIRYKITRGGVLFTAAILVVGWGAIISGNNLLFLISAAMMATLLVSGLVSRLCLAGLELDFLVPEHVAGEAQYSREAVREKSEVADALLLDPRGGRARSSQPVAEIGSVLPADRGPRHGGGDARGALSAARRLPSE